MNERSTRIPALSILLLFMLAVPVPQSFAEEPHPLNDSVQELMRRGEYEKALEQLKETFNLFPYDELTRRNLAAVYVAIGRRQLDRKEFDEAAKSFDDSRKLVPENRDYPILRGIALYSGKRYDEAAIVLEQELRNGVENVPLYYYLGCVYYYTGDLAKALEVWEKTLAIEPENKAVREMISKARRESAVESRMKNEYGSIFVISHDEGTKSDLADAVLDVLETAYNRVGSDLSHYPVVHIPVILYTRKDYRIVTAGPAWSGGLYDGKVRLPIGGATEITPALRGVLFHEYTHVLVAEVTKGNCPVWLTEGLAEFEARKEYDPPATELEKAAKTGAFLPFNTIEKSLSSLAASDAALAYQQSWSMVDFMISAYGLHKVRELLVNLGGGIGIDAAIAATFADYGLDYQAIMDEWKAAMRKKYGK